MRAVVRARDFIDHFACRDPGYSCVCCDWLAGCCYVTTRLKVLGWLLPLVGSSKGGLCEHKLTNYPKEKEKNSFKNKLGY